jgi:hypothetical protein
MSKVITFSRVFPSYHPRAGEPTGFIPKVWSSLLFDCKMQFDLDMPELESEIRNYYTTPLEYKHHTIRAGHRFKVGDYFSPRVWSDKPYRSKQIQFAPDIEIKKVYSFSIGLAAIYVDQQRWIDKSFIGEIAANDGLDAQDFLDWFQYPKPFTGQIICWNEQINY